MYSLDFAVRGLIFENALYKICKREGTIKSKPMHKGINRREENLLHFFLSAPKLPVFIPFSTLFPTTYCEHALNGNNEAIPGYSRWLLLSSSAPSSLKMLVLSKAYKNVQMPTIYCD